MNEAGEGGLPYGAQQDDSPDRPIRVLDLGRYVSGPGAATILADFGADVLKIEDISIGGDPIRNLGPGPRSMSYLWQVEARNKRSVGIDLHDPSGRELLRELVARADVLIENFRPGTMHGWGLGYEELRETNPGLVYVGITGYGQVGPYHSRAAVDATACAFGGLSHVTGAPDGPPTRPGLFTADWAAALFAAIGILVALRRRDADPQHPMGEYIDMALYEPLLRIADSSIADFTGRGVLRHRNGGVSRVVAPGGYYRCQDERWMAVTVPTPQAFMRFAEVVGPVWPTPDGRASEENRNDLAAVEDITRRWALTLPASRAVQLLCDVGIPAAVVNSVAELVQDPHIAARGNLIEVPGAGGETLTMQGVVPTLRNSPGRVRWAGEPLGASTDEALREWLGISNARLGRLHGEGLL